MWLEYRNLRETLGEIALYRCLDRIIRVFAWMLWVQQQTVDHVWDKPVVVEEHLLGTICNAEGQQPAASVGSERHGRTPMIAAHELSVNEQQPVDVSFCQPQSQPDQTRPCTTDE